MSHLFRFLLLLCFTGYVDCVVAQRRVSILFIGNSLTYVNDVPELVKAVASCDSVTIAYKSICFPDYALEDHWNDGLAAKEIKKGIYDFLIMQQGPSSQPEGRDLLVRYVKMFADVCKEHNTIPVLYMVWPSKARSFDFDGVFASYKLAADSVGGIFCPAGEAWRSLWKMSPDFQLYGRDNFHPGYKGSLLAAMMIYCSVAKKTDLNFLCYDRFNSEELSKSDFKLLLKAASKTTIR